MIEFLNYIFMFVAVSVLIIVFFKGFFRIFDNDYE